jgi:hypothetical protein
MPKSIAIRSKTILKNIAESKKEMDIIMLVYHYDVNKKNDR